MRRRACATMVLLMLMTGCTCSDENVIAKVGSAKITRADLRLAAGDRGADDASSSTALLDTLVRRELLAEGARSTPLRDEVRARLKAAEREILAQAFLDKRLAEESTEDAIRRYFEASKERFTTRIIHVQQVFIRTPPGATAAEVRSAERRMNEAQSQIQSGRDFGDVVKEFSTDGNEDSEGILPPIAEGQTNSEFFAAATALKAGETSPVVQTPLGFHLIRARRDLEVRVPSLPEVRGRVTAEFNREVEAKLLERLKKHVSVKTYPEHLERRSEP